MRKRIQNPFTVKLAMSIIALSLVGLIAMYVIVNTIVRNIIYENVIGLAHDNVDTISMEIDAWFNSSNHIVVNLARVLPSLGIDFIKQVSEEILDEYTFIADIYVGFDDGSIIGSRTGVPGDDWDSTTRSWYIKAKNAQGDIVTTSPYMSALENLGIITSVTKWIPDFNGMEAVVVISINIDYIISMVNEYRLDGGGYIILVNRNLDIVSHPNIDYTIGTEGIKNIRDIPNGDILAEKILSEKGVERFNDFRFGSAYFMKFPIESTGWTLAAVIPESTISEPVSQYLLIILLSVATILIGLFVLTMIFMALLTRNMEESRVTEERLRLMIDNMPLVSNFRDRDFNITGCNEAAVKLFGLSSKEEYKQRFYELSPKYQPDGSLSSVKAEANLREAFATGFLSFGWMHQKLSGEPVPTEVTLNRVDWRGEQRLIAFVRDLSDINNAVAMVEQLEKAAFTDVLTGARNRRYLMETAEQEIRECAEGGQPYSVIIMDVDHFKQVNDTYGHLVGDEVLKILVARIINSIKKETLVARYGGEEFIITLPNVNFDDVDKTAERIRRNIEASAFHIDNLQLNITISTGVASLNERTSSLSDIIGNADKALYRAKETGRNRVVVYRE